MIYVMFMYVCMYVIPLSLSRENKFGEVERFNELNKFCGLDYQGTSIIIPHLLLCSFLLFHHRHHLFTHHLHLSPSLPPSFGDVCLNSIRCTEVCSFGYSYVRLFVQVNKSRVQENSTPAQLNTWTT